VFELHYRRLNMGRQRIGWVIITSPRNFWVVRFWRGGWIWNWIE
jgi:hypothetical protein